MHRVTRLIKIQKNHTNTETKIPKLLMIDFEAQNTGPGKVGAEKKKTGFLAEKAGRIGIGITSMKTREVQEMTEIIISQEVIEMGDRKNLIILENPEPDQISMKSVYR